MMIGWSDPFPSANYQYSPSSNWPALFTGQPIQKKKNTHICPSWLKLAFARPNSKVRNMSHDNNSDATSKAKERYAHADILNMDPEPF